MREEYVRDVKESKLRQSDKLMRYKHCTIVNNSSGLSSFNYLLCLHFYFTILFPSQTHHFAILSSPGEQEDEFNIGLHNSALPSCLQLKRIFWTAFIHFYSINHSFSRGIRWRVRCFPVFLWILSFTDSMGIFDFFLR